MNPLWLQWFGGLLVETTCLLHACRQIGHGLTATARLQSYTGGHASVAAARFRLGRLLESFERLQWLVGGRLKRVKKKKRIEYRLHYLQTRAVIQGHFLLGEA